MVSSKRRSGGSGLPRSRNGGTRVKDKRYEDSRDRKSRLPRRASSASPSNSDYNPKRRRFLDPTLLARGMTSRCLGAKIQLTPLLTDEVEKDVRHMEAYSNACTAYAQQFFIFTNRALVQGGHYGPLTAPTVVSTEHYVNGEAAYDPYRRVMPVRIDPEEEKRISVLRKRIATSEAHREVLESEYMSLRAHYVFESQRLRRTRHAADGRMKIMQDLVKRRGKVVALRRLRCALARDTLKCLDKRNNLLVEQKGLPNKNEANGPEVLDVWNDIEAKLRDAENACRTVPIPDDFSLMKNDVKGKKKKDKRVTAGDDEDDRVVPWGCNNAPATPFDVPLLLSEMSSNPERSAAWSCGGMFGSKAEDMCWFENCLPKSAEKMSDEREELLKLRDEARFLNEELEKERSDNKDLQRNIIGLRKRSDEMCSMMTLLRGETETVLTRHNVLLETTEAKAAAQDLHNKAVAERVQRSSTVDTEGGQLGGEKSLVGPDSVHVSVTNSGKRESLHAEEHENDGDDELDDDEEEDGDINDEPPSEVVVSVDAMEE